MFYPPDAAQNMNITKKLQYPNITTALRRCPHPDKAPLRRGDAGLWQGIFPPPPPVPEWVKEAEEAEQGELPFPK